MKKQFFACLAMVLMATTVASGVAVNWDGSGSPATAGYTGTGSYATIFTLGVSFMNQATDLANGGGWTQDVPLLRSEGWELETSIYVSASVGSWGAYMAAGDDVGGAYVKMEKYYVRLLTSAGEYTSAAMAPGWRTFKLVMAPGGTDVSLYVNGDLEKTQACSSASGPYQNVTFGDGAGTQGATAIWDYVNVTPEPATVALLGIGCLMIRRRRQS